MPRPLRYPWLLFALLLVPARAWSDAPPAAPATKPTFIEAKAYHILPETHNNESGYFSLCEGLDGSLYVGTAKYGVNAYLVEFDPRKETQRIVIDVNALCGLSAKGYAAQAKIHTRNFVGPSGRIYVGSKQGYAAAGDTQQYPGGYVMAYDPRVGNAENLGMPLKGQGIIDVAADETRGLLYVVSCEEQHWLLGDIKGARYRELGPILSPYASTLITPDGKASALTADFQLAQYDPTTDKATVRPIDVAGQRFAKKDNQAIPTWVLAPDRKHAHLILMNDPTLLEIDLAGADPSVKAVSHGKMIDGKNPDSRCALSVAPDGSVYALVRIDNQTGFGAGYLNHLLRWDPKANATHDLGVLAIKNPDYVALKGADGKDMPFTNGVSRLPDNTLVPLYMMSLLVAHDGAVYITTISPFTLLRIDPATLRAAQAGATAAEAPAGPPATAAGQYVDYALAACDGAESQMDQITRIADVIAERHVAGGLIGFPLFPDALSFELWGRAGGIVHVGYERPFKAEPRTDAEKALDVGIVGFEPKLPPDALAKLKAEKARGCYLVGIGAKSNPALSECAALCDAWIDNGVPADDYALSLPGGVRAGHGSVLVNTIDGWTLTAEIVGALTRRGHMPAIWKSYSYPDAMKWGQDLMGKRQWQDEYKVPPMVPGELGARFLRQIRYPIRRIAASQIPALDTAAKFIHDESAQGRKTYVAWSGHIPGKYLGRLDDAEWAVVKEWPPQPSIPPHEFQTGTPDNALIFRLGYSGRPPDEAQACREHHERVIFAAGNHDDPAFQPTGPDLLATIDLGYALGDACVTVENFPIRICPASGVAQLVAYEAIDAEVRGAAAR